MTATRVAVYLGVAVFALLCALAAVGVPAALIVVVTVGALVLLIAGGNLLSGRPPGRGGAPPGEAPGEPGP